MTLADATIRAFLDDLASKSPTPGGGACAGVSGATAAALARMVIAYSIDKPKLAQHHDALRALDASFASSQRRLLELADEDAAAYARLNALFKEPKDAPDRAQRMSDAAERAALVPAEALSLAFTLNRELAELAPICSKMLLSDVGVASALALAGARSAWWNIRANLPLIADEARRDEIGSDADRRWDQAQAEASRAAILCGAQDGS